MALLKFTPSDILRSKILEDGWYSLTCKSASDGETSKDGGSVNFKITFVIDDQAGKELDYIINSKGMGFHVALVAAMQGLTKKDLKPEDITIDTEAWIGKKVDGHIIVDHYNNMPNNKIADFLPFGKGKAQAAKGVF